MSSLLTVRAEWVQYGGGWGFMHRPDPYTHMWDSAVSCSQLGCNAM